jgi:Domain of unknown function (DUF4352)
MSEQQASPAPEFVSPMNAPAQAVAEKARSTTPSAWFKRKRVLLPSALTVLLVITLAASGGLGSDMFDAFTSDPQPTATKAATATVPGLGSKAVDGKFSFVVTQVEHPGKTMPGKNRTTLTANGEFVIVRVNVTNTGAVAHSLDCQNQVLFNDKGKRYAPSPAILSTQDALKFVQLIEPGITVTGADLLFDVAPGTRVSTIELHDTRLTQGVMVALS